MAHKLRKTLVALILVAGFIWSLPMQPGRGDARIEPAAYSAADSPEFRISSYRALLVMTGHTRSALHERRLANAAREHFPAHDTQPEFYPLGVAPGWWDDATTGLVKLLVGMESPDAYLTQDALRIRAVVEDTSIVEEQLQVLRKLLPPSTAIDTQFILLNRDSTAAAFCEQQYAAQTSGPIAFEESGTEMRMSAYPVLDRVIALADACRGAAITITGHTDSTGSESWNQQLSLARARTVANYLSSRGIAPDRLVTVGAGSSLPIADNATRYGRGINRRIDIHFESTR